MIRKAAAVAIVMLACMGQAKVDAPNSTEPAEVPQVTIPQEAPPLQVKDEPAPEHLIEDPAYVPQLIQYSPTWDCRWCGPQKEQIESVADPPFKVNHVTRDGMGAYPQVWFSTPDDGWKRFRGYVSANHILSEWRKYHDCPAKYDTASSPGNPEVERTLTIESVQRMSASQLRELIRRWGTPLPRSGTVIGMTVTYHLTHDHGFSPSLIAGLTEGERHAIHQIAHNITDGRVTSTPSRGTAAPALINPLPVRPSYSNCPNCGRFHQPVNRRRVRWRRR